MLCLSLWFNSCSAHTTYLSARQMINHILVSALLPTTQSGLNRRRSINSSSLASFPISCVNIPTVDGSNTDFARLCVETLICQSEWRAWTAYLIFNCSACTKPFCAAPAGVRLKVNWKTSHSVVCWSDRSGCWWTAAFFRLFLSYFCQNLKVFQISIVWLTSSEVFSCNYAETLACFSMHENIKTWQQQGSIHWNLIVWILANCGPIFNPATLFNTTTKLKGRFYSYQRFHAIF